MRILSLCLLTALAGAVLVSCAPAQHSVIAQSAQRLVISGSLTMRERIALSPRAVAEVTLIEEASPGVPVLARQTIPFNGQQVPIAFNLAVEQSRLRPGANYTLHGTIQEGEGSKVWTVAQPVSVTPGAPRLDVGMLTVVRDQSGGGASPTPSIAATPYRARGNEPGWALEFGSRELSFIWNTGQDRMMLPLPAAQPTSAGRRYQAGAQGKTLVIEVINAVCRDTMSGMSYPDKVTVTFDGSRLEGCGGQPAALLQGGEWNVESIAGSAAVPDSKATLTFGNDGSVSGSGGCNRFTAAYTLTGEGLSIVPGIRTQMACDGPLIQQEDRFIDLLAEVQGFEIPAQGRLALVTETGERILARR